MTVQRLIRGSTSFYFELYLPTIALSLQQVLHFFSCLLLFISRYLVFFLLNHSRPQYYWVELIIKINKLYQIFLNLYNLTEMGACQNQFTNVPQPDSIELQKQYQYERQQQRFSTNSINLQHKAARPNSRNITIGMIDTKIQSVINQQIVNSKFGEYRATSFESRPGGASKVFMSGTKNSAGELKLRGKQIDKQQLHATARPFQGYQRVRLGQPEYLIPKKDEKNRQPLDLTFYHSLALPEFTYPPIKPQHAHLFQNLMVCQQEQRNGVRYIGQWKDLRTVHGNGVMQSNTTKYIGQFKDGLKHFYGRQIQKNQVYEGEFQNGRRKGKGRKYTLEGQEQGQFDNYLINGKIIYNNGNIYQGSLKNNKYHGKGKFLQKSQKMIYEGQFKNGKLNGEGTITLQDRIIYKGGFVQGLKQGKGQFNWSDSQYYQGEYAKGKKHGWGELNTGNRKYIGRFLNGKMDGDIKVIHLGLNGRQTAANVVRYENGVRSIYEDSSMMDGEDGIPQQWKNVLYKTQDDNIDRFYQQSSLPSNKTNLFSQGEISKNDLSGDLRYYDPKKIPITSYYNPLPMPQDQKPVQQPDQSRLLEQSQLNSQLELQPKPFQQPRVEPQPFQQPRLQPQPLQPFLLEQPQPNLQPVLQPQALQQPHPFEQSQPTNQPVPQPQPFQQPQPFEQPQQIQPPLEPPSQPSSQPLFHPPLQPLLQPPQQPIPSNQAIPVIPPINNSNPFQLPII